jgi:hypothetical protein
MSHSATHKLIELIVNAIDRTITIDSITQVGSTSVYTITTSNTKWLNVNRAYTIGADDYLVTDITPNTSFQVTLTQGQGAPNAGTITLPALDYRHGTLIAVNNERTQQQDIATYPTIVPFIYFNEPSNDTTYSSELDARDRDSDCEIYFMQEADHENWTNEKHYYYAVTGMENLIRSFITAAKNLSFVGELENYGSESHVKWGVVNQNGHVRNLFNEKLSGKKLNITLPFLKMDCSFDAYTPPSSGGASGTINVYIDSVLQSTTTSTDLNAEIVNITWT